MNIFCSLILTILFLIFYSCCESKTTNVRLNKENESELFSVHHVHEEKETKPRSSERIYGSINWFDLTVRERKFSNEDIPFVTFKHLDDSITIKLCRYGVYFDTLTFLRDKHGWKSSKIKYKGIRGDALDDKREIRLYDNNLFVTKHSSDDEGLNWYLSYFLKINMNGFTYFFTEKEDENLSVDNINLLKNTDEYLFNYYGITRTYSGYFDHSSSKKSIFIHNYETAYNSSGEKKVMEKSDMNIKNDFSTFNWYLWTNYLECFSIKGIG